MKFLTFSASPVGERLGLLLSDNQVLDLTASGGDGLASFVDLVEAGPIGLRRAKDLEAHALAGDPWVSSLVCPLSELRWRAPIPRPRKNVYCVGLNYRSHVEQNARALGAAFEIPSVPLFFSKPVTAVIGPGAVIHCDRRLTEKLDYEVELAIVIGKRGTWIPADQAMEYIFGYTLGNDVSARDLQFRTSQFLIGKGLDTFCPLGPVVVDRDSIPDPAAIVIELYVNGELRQQEAVSHMLFSVPTIISELSKGITLEPGDVILTGTPGGCGYQLTPPRFLQPGDLVECRAEPIGVLGNPVAAPSDTTTQVMEEVGRARWRL
ncbi:MAG TPA: fumarylacetoacetate hydrolase family protein [Chloroflexota bacterium]|nr:fumarylacetoacetate hydrolase family protein [Chloroflexota bacterium]